MVLRVVFCGADQAGLQLYHPAVSHPRKFSLRWENGDAIYLHETFYSIMQGYDAYMLKADVQVGGTDQLFNIITAARKLMTYLGAKPNIGVILGDSPGTDGEVKMSKSLGNHIPIFHPRRYVRQSDEHS